MEKKTIDMVNRIMDTGRMGYACVYPSDGDAMGEGNPMGKENPREEYLIATTPENMADFIGKHCDAHRITVTDVADRPILEAGGGLSMAAWNRGCARRSSPGWHRYRKGRWQRGKSSRLKEASRMHTSRQRTGQ